MAQYDTLISRYIDGELSQDELRQFHELLDASPDARIRLREMLAISGAAWRLQNAAQPKPQLEQALFARLSAEGLYRGRPVEPASAGTGSIRKWQYAAACLVALLLISAGLLPLMQNGARNSAGVPAGAASSPTSPNVVRTPQLKQPSPDADPASLSGSTSNPATAAITANRSELPASAGTAGGTLHTTHNRPGGERHLNHDIRHRSTNAATVSVQIPADTQNANGSHNNAVQQQPHAPTVSPESGTSVADSLHSGEHNIAQLNPIVPVAPLQSGEGRHTGTSATPSPAMPHAFGLSEPAAASVSSGGPVWGASLRGGVTAINAVSGSSVREVDVKVGMRLGGGHSLSLVVGVAPSMTETKSANTGVALAVPAPSRMPSRYNNSASGQQADEVTGSLESQQIVLTEPWLGIGYNYGLRLGDGLSLEPGIRSGMSASTFRFGAELPLRYAMSPSLSIECAASVSRVFPLQASVNNSTVLNNSNHFYYQESSVMRSFTTLGIQLGIHVDLVSGN
ncbi:MAG TPA: hypothetical protein VHI13_15485 [Candidatus Kapabacteria bacterium]|nr:hypothetical protein [Candidatus Kapabacteria bacterium]